MLYEVITCVDDNDALGHVDLGCGQANAGCLVHRIGQVVDQCSDLIVHTLHRLGNAAQAWVWVVQYLSDDHGEFDSALMALVPPVTKLDYYRGRCR